MKLKVHTCYDLQKLRRQLKPLQDAYSLHMKYLPRYCLSALVNCSPTQEKTLSKGEHQ